MSEVSLSDYLKMLEDRPVKFTPDEVGYGKAPEGSAMRCGICHHFYRRATDGFSTCEIMRSEETDAKGVEPHYRCMFYTLDAMVHPLLEEEPAKQQEEESDIPY